MFSANVRCKIQDRKRVELEVKLLDGTYKLQAYRANFSQHSVDPTCKLSNLESRALHCKMYVP